MDCAPPPYHTIVTLSQSVDDCSGGDDTSEITNILCFNSEDPPPYPG